MAHADNYYDLRERYCGVISAFRNCLGIDSSKSITMIIDRDIYSTDVLDTIAQDPTLQLITWEKNFKVDDTLWQKHKSFHFCMRKYRNNSKDTRHYHFHYMEIIEDTVEIKLFPSAYLEPKMKIIMEEFLENISKTSMVIPDGSNRKLTLSLMKNKTLKLANV